MASITIRTKVMSYFLIEEDDPAKLSEEVSRLLNEGWKLYGNPFYYSEVDTINNVTKTYPYYAQAMICEEVKEVVKGENS